MLTPVKLRDVIDAHDGESHAAALPDVAGDGFLYVHNAFYRRVRDAALRQGIGFVPDDSAYYGFPLLGLERVIDAGVLPYRRSMPPLRWLEGKRPGFFRLRDLKDNRPAPNYLLHEAAHAVAFRQVFGDARAATVFSDAACLPGVLLGESFAMSAEYLAACSVHGKLQRWFFSIASYRHRAPAKASVARSIAAQGVSPVIFSLLLGFLLHNYLVEPLLPVHMERIAGLMPPRWRRGMTKKTARRLLNAQNRLMLMSPEFRKETARLFLTTYGHHRDLRSILSSDPLGAFERSPALVASAVSLVGILDGEAPAVSQRGASTLAAPRNAAVGFNSAGTGCDSNAGSPGAAVPNASR